MTRLSRHNILVFIFIAITFFPRLCVASTKVGSTEAQIWHLEKSLYRFGTDVHRLPSTDEGLNVLVKQSTPIAGWQGPYLKKIEIPHDAWGNEYRYIYPAKYSKERFDLYSFGTDGIDNHGDKDDVSSWKGYDGKYYKKTEWSYDEIVGIIILIDFPVALLIYFAFIRKRRSNGDQLKT